jgi:hypothetical protein
MDMEPASETCVADCEADDPAKRAISTDCMDTTTTCEQFFDCVKGDSSDGTTGDDVAAICDPPCAESETCEADEKTGEATCLAL